jgi:hypothetical protein
MSHLLSRFAAPLAILLCVVPVSATAKDKEPPVQIQELYACRDLADPAARLACFDREVGELATADTNRDISFADRATVKKARRGLFGFSLPNLGGLFGRDDEDDKAEDRITSIESTIKAVSMDKSGKYRITLEDGALWVQIDGMGGIREPQAGQKITIKAAAMGSYFAKVEGGRSFRMRRER